MLSEEVNDTDYSTESLRDIMMGTDARIDDPELLTSKKDLMLKGQNPLSLINALAAKWKTYGKLIDLNNVAESKDAEGKSMFRYRIGIPKVCVGEATDTSKQRAKIVASQHFLK